MTSRFIDRSILIMPLNVNGSLTRDKSRYRKFKHLDSDDKLFILWLVSTVVMKAWGGPSWRRSNLREPRCWCDENFHALLDSPYQPSCHAIRAMMHKPTQIKSTN